MGAFAEIIEKQIEDEIQRRLAEYVSKLAVHFFTSEREIYKVVQSSGPVEYTRQCQGQSKSGKACKNTGKYNGYCHLHKKESKHVKRVKHTDYEQVRDTASSTGEFF
jgi:hypothetical protein